MWFIFITADRFSSPTAFPSRPRGGTGMGLSVVNRPIRPAGLSPACVPVVLAAAPYRCSSGNREIREIHESICRAPRFCGRSIATPKGDGISPSPLALACPQSAPFSFRVFRVFRGSTELFRLKAGLRTGAGLHRPGFGGSAPPPRCGALQLAERTPFFLPFLAWFRNFNTTASFGGSPDEELEAILPLHSFSFGISEPSR